MTFCEGTVEWFLFLLAANSDLSCPLVFFVNPLAGLEEGAAAVRRYGASCVKVK